MPRAAGFAELPLTSEIDAVLFDAGGVLLLPDADAGQQAFLTIDCKTERADWHRAHYLANVVVEEMEIIDWIEVRRTVARAVGVPSARVEDAVPLIEQLAVATPWVAVDGAGEAIRRLADGGYRTAVVSNANGQVEAELELLGVCSVTREGLPHVGIVVDSRVVGIEKPDPRIFDIALGALGVDPDRALYVGDTVRFDVRGALAAGLHPVHLDPFELCDGTHCHISALDQLTDWLLAAVA